MRIHIFLILCCLFFLPSIAQPRRPGGKPVLIRDDQTQQEEEEKVIIQNPAEAKRHMGVGDFYYKRQNYKAAAERYRTAIDYALDWYEAYDKLTKALARQGEYDAAIEVCSLFETNNPDSGEIEKARKRARKLEEERGQN